MNNLTMLLSCGHPAGCERWHYEGEEPYAYCGWCDAIQEWKDTLAKWKESEQGSDEALTRSQARCTRLRAVLQEIVDLLEPDHRRPGCPSDCDCCICNAVYALRTARAALEDKP